MRRLLAAALIVVVVAALGLGLVVVERRVGVSTLADAAAHRLSTVGRTPPATPGPAPSQVSVRVDTRRMLRPISPLIYGIAVANQSQLRATGAHLNRWGGNPNTRYNWTLGSAWNAARDWDFRNYGGPPAAPSSSADAFVETNWSLGVQSVVSVPAIGWVARDGDNASRSVDVPWSGGPPLAANPEAIAGYDPSANRAVTSIRSRARASADTADAGVAQDAWIKHLVARFGAAAMGGVGYYVIDNEPDLWATTHTDVHPVEPSYDDMLSTFVDYASAIKDADPTAEVLGPALSGWTSLFYSARDRGTDNFRRHADRRAHGDQPFLAWWLDQVHQNDQRRGRRTLDILDVHYYPQASGVYSAADDPATNALRLRSTRSLWDPAYVDESWIDEPVMLIPRLRAWIDQYYPGTRLAVNEWNWGAETTLNGALAIADVLGIYGREGVDMAAYWTAPPPGSPGALAFAMYTNFDGQGRGFGDQALAATSNFPNDVTAYASRDSSTGDILVLALNKRSDGAIPMTLTLDDGDQRGAVELYRLSAGAPGAIERVDPPSSSGSAITTSLAAESITLIVLSHR